MSGQLGSGSKSEVVSRAATFMPRLLAGVVALGLAAPRPAAAQQLPSLLVLPASGRGVATPILQRARSLLVERLGRPDRFRVVDVDRPPTPVPRPIEEGAGMAILLGADLVVAFDLSSQAGQAVFDISCWDVLTGAPACRLREATLAGPDALPFFAERMALQLMNDLRGRGSSAGVRAWRTMGPRREAGPRPLGMGVRAGFVVPVVSPANETFALSGFGLLFTATTRHVHVDFGADYLLGAEGRRLRGVGLGLLLPLGGAEQMPYFSAGIWWMHQRLGGQGAQGLQLRPMVGMSWLRPGGIRVRVEAGYFVSLFHELEEDRLIPGSGEPHRSRGFIAAVGATY